MADEIEVDFSDEQIEEIEVDCSDEQNEEIDLITRDSNEEQRVDSNLTSIPSNVCLLNIAFVSFLGFMILQTFAAFIAKSEAMMGDSASMSVDALTYAFNLVAEKRKDVADRRTKLLLELIPPTISVVVLVILTIFLAKVAIVTLIHGVPENPDDEPNVVLMFIFSTSNLLLDFINIFCFARANHALGYNTMNEEDIYNERHLGQHDETEKLNSCDTTAPDTLHADDDDEGGGTNLNMCSAYTHVFADTLRSIAVIIAASIAKMVDSIDPEEADATAAIAVSIIIAFSLIPLFRGIIHTWSELKALKSDVEKNEEQCLELE